MGDYLEVYPIPSALREKLFFSLGAIDRVRNLYEGWIVRINSLKIWDKNGDIDNAKTLEWRLKEMGNLPKLKEVNYEFNFKTKEVVMYCKGKIYNPGKRS